MTVSNSAPTLPNDHQDALDTYHARYEAYAQACLDRDVLWREYRSAPSPTLSAALLKAQQDTKTWRVRFQSARQTLSRFQLPPELPRGRRKSHLPLSYKSLKTVEDSRSADGRRYAAIIIDNTGARHIVGPYTNFHYLTKQHYQVTRDLWKLGLLSRGDTFSKKLNAKNYQFTRTQT